jgi:hypothetical protein
MDIKAIQMTNDRVPLGGGIALEYSPHSRRKAARKLKRQVVRPSSKRAAERGHRDSKYQ